MFEDWAALVALPAMGLGFASLYIWFMLRPGDSGGELEAVRPRWLQAAHKLGGVLRFPEGDTGFRTTPTLTATVGNTKVDVEARSWREWAYAQNAIEYANRFQTVITALADAHRDLHLVLAVEERELAEGASFSERFRVRSSNADLASAWLNEDFYRQALSTKGYTYFILRGRVFALAERLEDDPEQLEAATRAVAALAGRSEALLSAWRATAQRMGGHVRSRIERWEPDGRTSIVAERGGSLVVIDTELQRPGGDDAPVGLLTRVRASVSGGERVTFALHGREVPRFALYFPRVDTFDSELAKHFILRSPTPPLAAQRFDPELSRVITELSPQEIYRDEEWVTLRVQGLVECPRQLERAVHVATELSRSIWTGPYR